MILEEKVEIIGNSKNLKYYRERGYKVDVGEKIIVETKDLSHGSTFKVLVSCDVCNVKKKISWSSYVISTSNDKDGKYYCITCALYVKKTLTNIEKYGGKSPACSNEVVNKIKNTNMKKYGNNSSLHGSRQLETEKIFLEKFGNKVPLKSSKSKEILKKMESTNIEKYGGKSPLNSKNILYKVKKTNIERYGVDNVSKNKEIINKIRNHFFQKYGKYYVETDEFKEKSKESIEMKYGPNGYHKSQEKILKVINDRSMNYPGISIVGYSDRFFDILCDGCGEKFSIRTDLLYKRFKNGIDLCTKCTPLNSMTRSSGEISICNFLEENNIEFTISNRTILTKYELDIYIESKKIAIEFNGMYWHSEYFKEKKYHYDKYKSCIDRGIQLIQIWEDDWNHKKEIIKSILLNKLGISPNTVGARKCKLEVISRKESNSFLNENHVQGSCKSSINISLKYNNEIISLMTFGKRRINSKETLELIRFCNKIGYSIPGAASKLLGYFKGNFSHNKIISYSDNSISNGDLYDKLGFKNTNETINYYWCDGKFRHHRFKFNKKKLISEGQDPSKTESEIMNDLGYYKIFGAGIKTWTLNSIFE